MPEAYIVDAVRTPVGRRGGGLSQVHPADLGAHSIRALLDRTGIDPGAVEDVVFGNVDSVGGQAGDIARTCWLVAGGPEHVPGTTVDRQCGSAQQAIHFAAQAVLSGTMDVVVAPGLVAPQLAPSRQPPLRRRTPLPVLTQPGDTDGPSVHQIRPQPHPHPFWRADGPAMAPGRVRREAEHGAAVERSRRDATDDGVGRPGCAAPSSTSTRRHREPRRHRGDRIGHPPHRPDRGGPRRAP